MKCTPNSKIQSIPFVKPLSETSFPRFSGRGEQLHIRVVMEDLVGQILKSCNTYYSGRRCVIKRKHRARNVDLAIELRLHHNIIFY